jgi:RNA recognition motif-containing protein
LWPLARCAKGRQIAVGELAGLVSRSGSSNQRNSEGRIGSMNMYVGNLAYSVTEEELKKAFSEFGEVSSVKIITDKFSGQSKGFGFVEMPNNSEADQAIKALNGKVLSGRSIKVNQAEARSKRPQQRRPRY